MNLGPLWICFAAVVAAVASFTNDWYPVYLVIIVSLFLPHDIMWG